MEISNKVSMGFFRDDYLGFQLSDQLEKGALRACQRLW